MRAHRSRTAGFLLTETLATFAISAFVLIGLASTAPVLLRAVDRSVANVQDVDDLGRTLDALRRDLSGLQRARWNGFEPQAFIFHGGPNSLFFAHREHHDDGTIDIQVIALREIVADDGSTRLVRSEARLPHTARSFDDLHFGPQRTLGTGPARLRFWYLPAALGMGTEPPRGGSWQVGPRLPAAILVEAVDARSTKLLVTMRIPIHADADIGCLAGGGAAGQTPGAQVGAPAAVGSVAAASAGASTLLGTPSGGTPPTLPGAGDASSAFCGRDDTAAPAGAPPPPPGATL